MKERGILFSAPMVRAILDGSKTQTRRIAKGDPGQFEDLGLYMAQTLSPFGYKNDRLWVREAWRTPSAQDNANFDLLKLLAINGRPIEESVPIQYEADKYGRNWPEGARPGRYRHARFMPRWASRISLEITGVRVEQLQDISEADAIAEGIRRIRDGFERFHPCPTDTAYEGLTRDPVLAYRGLWESINGAGSWDANPWVWVVEFKRIDGE